MEFKVPFSGRAHAYTQEEKDIVIQAMEDSNPLTQGKYMLDFQEKFSQYIDMPFCFAINNATGGLEMAAQLCQFSEGDEIIIPSHTFTSSAYPFAKQGAKIVWADIDPATRVVTADTISKLITPRTKAIVVVHLYGYVVEMEPIIALAKKHNILVIEDTAQSVGASINGQMSGSFGDIGIFSFHSHKNISTLGEGGMIAVKNKKFAEVLPLIRHNGSCGFKEKREFYWKPAMGNVVMPELNGQQMFPNNFCLGEVECALGSKLLDRIDTMNANKRARAFQFMNALNSSNQLEFHRENSDRHCYHLLVAKVNNGERDEFISKMAFEKKVQCIVQYLPLDRYPFYQKLGFGKSNCPNTDEFFDCMVSFPFHQWLSDDDFTYMLESTQSVLKELHSWKKPA